MALSLSLSQLFQQVLIPYEDNGQKIYFLGQLNKNGSWDGDCVTNVYKDGKLIGIFEYNLIDGKYNTCKSFYKSDTDCEWIYVNKSYIEKKILGESTKYKVESNLNKEFDITDVKGNNILYVKDFIESNNFDKLSYYKGELSNGKYNDKSGDAFLVIYFEPNTIKNKEVSVIKTFYNGKFENGNFKEEKYDSWYITREEDTKYMYYKRGFNGKTIEHKDKEDFKPNLSHDDIDYYLNKYGFSEYSNQFITEYED